MQHLKRVLFLQTKDFVTAERLSRYSGIVIAIRNRGLGSNFTILNVRLSSLRQNEMFVGRVFVGHALDVF